MIDMKYQSTHPRKVRGGSVHKTKSEKRQDDTEKMVDETIMRSVCMVEREPFDERILFNAGGEEESSHYTVPEVYNFVDARDVKVVEDRVMLWLNSGYPVHLIGPTGCGKTMLAMHAAKKLGRPVVWINGDEAVTTSDLIGGYAGVEQESIRDRYIHNVFKSTDILRARWVDNPLTIACKYGYTLVYNEFSRTLPTANNVLLSVFEEGILELPTKFGSDRYLKVHPDFNAILTSNSIEYAGQHKPQDALLDRMVSIYMDYYSFDTEVDIVTAHTTLPAKEAKKVVRVVRMLRDALPDAQKPGTRACIMIGHGLKAMNGQDTMSLEQLYTDVIAAKVSSLKELIEKRELVKDALQKVG